MCRKPNGNLPDGRYDSLKVARQNYMAMVQQIMKGQTPKQNMHGRIQFKRGKGENIIKPKLHSRIRQSQEFLQRCFHFSPSIGGGGRGAGMPIRADERRRKGIIIPPGMRTSLVTDNGSGGGAKEGE